jgi:predicted DNA repair protein MutK
MSAGLFGLLDDVAVLARLAAATGRATAKAAGVVIDDTAVTPQYVHGIAAERELPIIKKIALGSLRNKLLLILPAAMVLSQFAPRLLIPILMLGATYLCYEGAEKLWGSVRGHHADAAPVAENEVVTGAIRTDLVLSAEIMVIALNEVVDQSFVPRLIILIVVALLLTVVVYGVVAVIVKMDDVGLYLTETGSRVGQSVGRGLLAAMPKLLSLLSTVGVLAMFWVGGHILREGIDHLGWHALEGMVGRAVEAVGGVLAWPVGTAVSAVIGLVVGVVVFALMHLLSVITRSAS